MKKSRRAGFDPRSAVRTADRVAGDLASQGIIVPSPSRGRLVAERYHEYSHPSLYEKRHALVDAIDLVAHFCVENGLTIPAFADKRIASTGRRATYGQCSKWRGEQYLVAINSTLCAVPQTAGKSWSWPGYNADVTVAGVTAHEIGHLCHWHGGSVVTRRTFREMDEAIGDEPNVSSYEPDHGERFAEAMKLFVLNPTYLAAAWPRRYSFLRERFDPVVETDWTDLLADSPRHLKAAARKVSKHTTGDKR